MKTHLKLPLVYVSMFLTCMGTLPLSALPNGAHGVVGAVVNDPSDGVLTIDQFSNRAILNWDDFSIGAGELTRFNQPGSDAWALNRVTGIHPSVLAGRLEANGNIILLNSHGIQVGPNGVIDVNGFIGSTLNVSDADFLAGGDLPFEAFADSDSTGEIVNLGRIRAQGGDVYLIGSRIVNEGEVNAWSGRVGVAAGFDEVLLKREGSRRLYVSLDGSDWVLPENLDAGASSATGDEARLVNRGNFWGIEAELASQGGNTYALALNNEGTIWARGVEERDGEVWLVASNGNIENHGIVVAHTSDRSGGNIHVSAPEGGYVGYAGSTLSASGKNDGHIKIRADWVNIEGFYKGQLSITASSVTFLPDASTKSDDASGDKNSYDSGNRLSVGTVQANNNNNSSGAAYLFKFTDAKFTGGSLAATSGSSWTAGVKAGHSRSNTSSAGSIVSTTVGGGNTNIVTLKNNDQFGSSASLNQNYSAIETKTSDSADNSTNKSGTTSIITVTDSTITSENKSHIEKNAGNVTEVADTPTKPKPLNISENHLAVEPESVGTVIHSNVIISQVPAAVPDVTFINTFNARANASTRATVFNINTFSTLDVFSKSPRIELEPSLVEIE